MAQDFDEEEEERRCDECGNHAHHKVTLDGRDLFECDLCGKLSGKDEDVIFAEKLRDARARGIDPEIYELVLALDGIRGVHVEQSSGGDVFLKLPPFVRFVIGDKSLTSVDNIAHSLELAHRSLKHRWIFKAGVNRGLYFEMLPGIDAGALTDVTLAELRTDTLRLATCFNRDRHLSWWKK